MGVVYENAETQGEDGLTILRCKSILEVDKFVFANVK